MTARGRRRRSVRGHSVEPGGKIHESMRTVSIHALTWPMLVSGLIAVTIFVVLGYTHASAARSVRLRSVWSAAHVDRASNDLLAVSCPSASLCVVGDANGDVLTSTRPTRGAGAWRTMRIDGTRLLLAMSCPSLSLCVAGDNDGNILTSTDPAGGAKSWRRIHVENAGT